MFDGHTYGMGGGFMFVFWLLVIIAIVWIAKLILSSGRSRHDSASSAREILERRLARGEIDEEEFERKSRMLEQ